jgi:hypothetical protein
MKDTKVNRTFWDEYREDISDIHKILTDDYDTELLRNNFIVGVKNFVNAKRKEFEEWLTDNNIKHKKTFSTQIREWEKKIPEEGRLMFWRYTFLCLDHLSNLPLESNFESLSKYQLKRWEIFSEKIDKNFSEIFTGDGMILVQNIFKKYLRLDEETFKKFVYNSFALDTFYNETYSLSESFIYIDKKDKSFHIVEQSLGIEGVPTFIRPGTHVVSHLYFPEYLRVVLEENKSSQKLFDLGMNVFRILLLVDTAFELDEDELNDIALSVYNNDEFKNSVLNFFEKSTEKVLTERNEGSIGFRFGKIPVYKEIAEKYLKNKTIEFAF